MVLIDKDDVKPPETDDENLKGVYNIVSTADKLDLARRRTKTEKSDKYMEWLENDQKEMGFLQQKVIWTCRSQQQKESRWRIQRKEL